MRIIICVTSDIVTDQRVNRIALTLQKLPASITIAGIKRRKSLPAGNPNTGVKRFSMVFLKGPLFYMEYNLRLFFYLLFSRSDIIVSNDLDTLPAAYFSSAIKRCPLVYDSHEYFTEVPELVNRRFVRGIWSGIEKMIVPAVRYAYTVSAPIAEAYRKRYGVSFHVIRNLPFRNNGSPVLNSLKRNIEKLIIYQGALNTGRGIEHAILAMKFMNNCRLLIAGAGYLENELKDLVLSNGLSDKVNFLGLVRPEELVNITAQADLGLSLEESQSLNYKYALPNKLFDYIQAGIPVLIANLPEMAAIVNKYKVGKIISGHDPRDIAEAFKEMLFNETLREEWKSNLEIAASELCWENEEAKLFEIYHEVLKDHAFLTAGK